MRSLLLAFPLALVGCAAERDSFEPVEPGSVARSKGDVRCSADEGGNLHVRAPADARVTADHSTGDATADVTYGTSDPNDYQMPRPTRPMSRSLGFIGDAPLTQGPNHGGRYSYGAHDNLIPPHHHSTGFTTGYGRGWGYRSYSSYGYGYGAR